MNANNKCLCCQKASAFTSSMLLCSIVLHTPRCLSHDSRCTWAWAGVLPPPCWRFLSVPMFKQESLSRGLSAGHEYMQVVVLLQFKFVWWSFFFYVQSLACFMGLPRTTYLCLVLGRAPVTLLRLSTQTEWNQRFICVTCARVCKRYS